ncbi:MAG: hypothetical protein Q4F79_00285 [Eubacteriales bacterium]|nr:hypothetical protein [Eubacteriales bacterium]
MTRAEKENRLQVLKALAEEKVKEYNEAMQDGKFDEVSKLDTEITDTVNEYTSIVRDMCFEDCAASDDPMMAAVTALSFMTIGVKDTKKGDEKLPVREVIEKERQIDLLKLHKFVDGGIGHNKEWVYMIEKFNLLMTCQKAKDLGVDPTAINDSYAMSEIAKGYDLGKNPASKTNLLKTLTAIVQAMVGDEYKPVSHDVNFLLSVYSRKSRKALTVTCANHKYMRGYIMEICHRIVTGKTYEVDYKRARNA